MTVYEITISKEKLLEFDNIKQLFNYKLKTNVLNEANPINIGEKELNYSHRKKPYKSYLELYATDKRFINFLKEKNFDFELSERDE